MPADAAPGMTRARRLRSAALAGAAAAVAVACAAEAPPPRREAPAHDGVRADSATPSGRAAPTKRDAAGPGVAIDDVPAVAIDAGPGGAIDELPAVAIDDVPAVAIDAAVVDRYPSLRAYPDASSRLQSALAAREGPREVLLALAEAMAPYRWPGALDWDRHGFIAIDGARRGFVTRVAGGLIAQPGDRHDLGCAGGFLEGVRLTLLPDLAIADLDRCARARAVVGAPDRCDPTHDYGLLALAGIAARLAPARLPAGPTLFELDPRDAAAIDRLAAPGALHLCSVSHTSPTHAGARFYHHMLIVLGTAGADDLEVFDTTGARGVSLVTMPRGRFFRYCTTQLAASEAYRYASRSARLTCLAVAAAR